MGTETSKASLFDKHLVSDLINKVKGHSSLAKLSSQKPIPFNGSKEFTFTLDSDIDVVAENGKKTHGGLSLEPVTIVPIKVEYGARLSDEFLYATEEEKIDILKAFNEGFAKKLARGIDLMAMHGINPRTKKASDVIGTNHFDSKVTQVVKFTESEDADANIEAAVNLIQGAEGVVTGLAMDTEFSTALAKVTNGEMGPKMYPELAWGADPDSINGLKSSVNTTVGAGADEAESKDLVIIGDFESMFKWGYAKQIPMEIIGYVSEDGVTNEDTRSSENIKAWGGDIVGAVQTEKEDTFTYKLIESLNVEVLKEVYGAKNVTGDLDAGIHIKSNSKELEAHVIVVDMIMNGGILKRIVLPNAKVDEVGEIVYVDGGVVGYETTLKCFPDENGDTHHEYIVKPKAQNLEM